MKKENNKTAEYEAPRIVFETLIADTIMCSGEPAGCKNYGLDCTYDKGKTNNSNPKFTCIVGC